MEMDLIPVHDPRQVVAWLFLTPVLHPWMTGSARVSSQEVQVLSEPSARGDERGTSKAPGRWG